MKNPSQDHKKLMSIAASQTVTRGLSYASMQLDILFLHLSANSEFAKQFLLAREQKSANSLNEVVRKQIQECQIEFEESTEIDFKGNFVIKLPDSLGGGTVSVCIDTSDKPTCRGHANVSVTADLSSKKEK